MRVLREWATPLTIGVFVVSALTGLTMFFEADTGFGKLVHQWLGWVLVVAVALHVAVNFASFRRHLTKGSGRWLVMSLVVLAGATFFEPTMPPPPDEPPPEAEEETPAPDPVEQLTTAVLHAPLAEVAALADASPETLAAALRTAGFDVRDVAQSLSEIAGDDRDAQLRALSTAFAAPLGEGR